MAVESSIVADLLTQSTVTAITSDIYEYERGAPGGAFIIVRGVTNVLDPVTQSLREGGVSRVSIFCHADTVANARTLGNAVVAVYRDRTGTVGDYTVNWIEISDARVLFGPGKEFRYLVDIVVHYEEEST